MGSTHGSNGVPLSAEPGEMGHDPLDPQRRRPTRPLPRLPDDAQAPYRRRSSGATGKIRRAAAWSAWLPQRLRRLGSRPLEDPAADAPGPPDPAAPRSRLRPATRAEIEAKIAEIESRASLRGVARGSVSGAVGDSSSPVTPPASIAPTPTPFVPSPDERALQRWDRDDLGDVRQYREPDAIPTRQALRTSQPRIVMRCPDASNADFCVDDKLVDIGRDVTRNTFVLPHRSVSKLHARIFWSGRRFVLEDLGSTNRTFTGGAPLRPGQRVQLRSHQAIRFGSVLCLFLMQPLRERDRLGMSPKRVLSYLLERRWITTDQAREAVREEQGRLDDIAARFVRQGVLAPEQWEQAYKWAEAAEVVT